MARLEKLDFLARKILSGELRGERRTPRRGSGTLFRDHKNYSQGDDLRFVDWNAYSRLGELLVKQFESEENLDLLLFLDASGSMDWGTANKMDYARRIAAALGFIGLRRHAKVELVPMPERRGEGRSRFFGSNRVLSYLEALERVVAEGEVDLQEAVRAGVGRRRGRGLAVVLSDFMTESDYGRALQFLRHAGFRVAAVQVLDRQDLHPDIAGLVRLVD
ncbi:MAG: DUF58 domain-containing protein, partial [Salinibacterium sp.]|nr:DUF58 domain-containing protein [Salinibacterium sp.]